MCWNKKTCCHPENCGPPLPGAEEGGPQFPQPRRFSDRCEAGPETATAARCERRIPYGYAVTSVHGILQRGAVQNDRGTGKDLVCRNTASTKIYFIYLKYTIEKGTHICYIWSVIQDNQPAIRKRPCRFAMGDEFSRTDRAGEIKLTRKKQAPASAGESEETQ